DSRPLSARRLRVLAQEVTQTETGPGDGLVARLQPSLRGEPLEILRRFSDVPILAQRLAEVQIHETASPGTANGHELFQIIELDRDSRFVESAMELGIAEVDHAQRQVGGRATGRIQRRQIRLQRAGSVLVVM